MTGWTSIRRNAAALALAMAFVGAPGCHHQLPRLVAAGKHQEVVDKVAGSKYEPRRKAARAYAEALEALGRVEEAREVLARDFRKTGETRSLVALADLEARLGLLGLAVPHYARASSLDAKILAGRGDVCGLLERRAARFYEQGEGLAADLDMRRVKELCGAEGSNARTVGGARGPDLALWKRIRALAEEQVRAQRATPRCKEKGACSELDAKADARLTAELVAAHEKGPAALRELARTGVSLAAADVVALLAAELDGDLGVDLISQDELRGWLGYAEMVDLADAMSRVSPEIAAYVRLRVEALGPSYAIPGAGQPVARSRAALISRILDNLGDDRAARGWRVLVVAGDVGAAEFELTSGLQRTGAGEAGEPRQAAVPQPEHWSARVPVTAASLDELLILARMRDRAGERAQALEITRFAAAEAHALGLAGALELSIDEARRQLAAGRPWSAMAIADALPGDRVRRVKQAAGGAISVMDAACEGGCGLQEDRAVVERVMGEAWVKQAAGRLIDPAFTPAAVPAPIVGCPSLAELLSAGAQGPLADALRAARVDLHGPTVATALRKAVESDLTLVCAGRHVLPLLQIADYRLSAEILADELAQAPQMIAGNQRELQALLALLSGNGEQAELHARAAGAASVDPAGFWRRAAGDGRRYDARDYELAALHQALLHEPPADAADLRLALMTRVLRDIDEGWVLEHMEVGRDTVLRQVAAHFAALPAARRWHEREALAGAVAGEPWQLTARGLVVQALWPELSMLERHPAAVARIEAQIAGLVAPTTPDPLSPRQLALAIERELLPAPPVVATTFLAADELMLARLAHASAHADTPEGLAAAVGVAFTGPAPLRVAAMRALLGELDRRGLARQRDQIVAMLLAGLVAVAPGGASTEPVIVDPDALVTLTLRIEPDPADGQPS